MFWPKPSIICVGRIPLAYADTESIEAAVRPTGPARRPRHPGHGRLRHGRQLGPLRGPQRRGLVDGPLSAAEVPGPAGGAPGPGDPPPARRRRGLGVRAPSPPPRSTSWPACAPRPPRRPWPGTRRRSSARPGPCRTRAFVRVAAYWEQLADPDRSRKRRGTAPGGPGRLPGALLRRDVARPAHPRPHVRGHRGRGARPARAGHVRHRLGRGQGGHRTRTFTLADLARTPGQRRADALVEMATRSQMVA
jgi:hypothetical protein